MRILNTGTISTASSGNVTTSFSAVREKSNAQFPASLTAYANFAYGSGGTSVDVYVQTSFDGGGTWVDIANFHFTTSAGKRMYTLSASSVTSIATPTDGSLSANTSVNGFLGPIYRAKWTSVGTYGGATSLTVDLSFGEGAGGSPGATGATGPTGPTGPAGPGTMVQLAQTITSGSQATVDFQSISGSYRNLKIVFNSADTHAGTDFQQVFLKFNNDGTSGNYTSTLRIISANGTGTTTYVAPSSSGMFSGIQPQAGTSNASGIADFIIPDYSQTTFFKSLGGTYGAFSTNSGVQEGALQGVWKSTAAVTRLTFSTDGTAFLDGSTFTLYGMV